jgi:hypothetical protein
VTVRHAPAAPIGQPAVTTHRRDGPQRARSYPKSIHLASCGATPTSVAHMPRRADVTAIDAQVGARLLPAHERGGQRIALTPVCGLRIPVRTPMRSQTSDSVGVSGLPAFTPGCLLSARHQIILLAGPRKGRATSPRRQASPREMDVRGPDASRIRRRGKGVKSGAPGPSQAYRWRLPSHRIPPVRGASTVAEPASGPALSCQDAV